MRRSILKSGGDHKKMTLEIEITDKRKSEQEVDVDFRDGKLLVNVTFNPSNISSLWEIICSLRGVMG